MERIGLLGLPNSGKTSLFNALTGLDAPVAPHPYTTTETAVATAQVADERLDALAAVSESQKIVHATIEVTDVAGLAKGASQGEGLGNRFLAAFREVDALCYVLRAFENPLVSGTADPAASLEELELELVMADLVSLEGQAERRRKAARQDPKQAPFADALEAACAVLGRGIPLYRGGLSLEQLVLLRQAFPITAKPLIVVINIGEDRLEEAKELEAQISARLGEGVPVIAISAKLEAELARLDPRERAELQEGLGISEAALARLTKAAYGVLGRDTFFTTGEKETRAWTFRRGSTAAECAGVIHSDLQRGFIRAEVIFWRDLVELGSKAAAKAAGKLRLEGRDYLVQDGDVLEIRFNVR
jgi:GTP-binding protein YchF